MPDTSTAVAPAREPESTTTAVAIPDELRMPRTTVLTFGVYFIALSLLLIYLLIKLWPGVTGSSVSEVAQELNLLGIRVRLWPETRLLLIVACAGALGSYIHCATSFADFVGNRQIVGSWACWYVLRPFIGAGLALLLYFTVRGGLVTGAANLSLYGVAALAGLSGMFSKQATDKLKELFDTLFKTDGVARRDKLAKESQPIARS